MLCRIAAQHKKVFGPAFYKRLVGVRGKAPGGGPRGQRPLAQWNLNALDVVEGGLAETFEVVLGFDLVKIADLGMSAGMLGGKYRAAVLVGQNGGVERPDLPGNPDQSPPCPCRSPAGIPALSPPPPSPP